MHVVNSHECVTRHFLFDVFHFAFVYGTGYGARFATNWTIVQSFHLCMDLSCEGDNAIVHVSSQYMFYVADGNRPWLIYIV